MVLGRAKLKPVRSGLMPARNLRTRIISGRALERSLISLVHDLRGETWVKVYVYAFLLLETLARASLFFQLK